MTEERDEIKGKKGREIERTNRRSIRKGSEGCKGLWEGKGETEVTRVLKGFEGKGNEVEGEGGKEEGLTGRRIGKGKAYKE